jgi:7-cyano-7-deazaguanine synthase
MAVAVLLSGGLDSAVLLWHAAAEADVQPIYVRAGLAWEADERRIVDRLLRAPAIAPHVQPLASLQVDMRDVYTTAHWAVRGEPPGYHTADEDVYLAGRNVILLSKAAVFMARSMIQRVMIGTLAGNPFPDATAEFFASMQCSLTLGLGAPIHIEAPFSSMHKADVIRLGQTLGVPFDLTLSCMQPRHGRHCGNCSKCRERADAFREAEVPDPALTLRETDPGA